MIRTRLHCDLPGALLNFTNLETFEDWKKSPSFLEAALYIRPHSLIGRSKKLKNFIEAAAYQRSFTVFVIPKERMLKSYVVCKRLQEIQHIRQDKYKLPYVW